MNAVQYCVITDTTKMSFVSPDLNSDYVMLFHCTILKLCFWMKQHSFPARSLLNQLIRSVSLTLLSQITAPAGYQRRSEAARLGDIQVIHLRAGPPPPPRSIKPAETGKHKREMEHNAPAESPPQSAHCSHCISICATETLLKLWPCHATALRGRCVRFSRSLLLCDFSISAFTRFNRESGLQGCQLVFCAHISHTLQK